MSTTAPILSPDEAAAEVRRHRRQGAIVALANGCFDLLHVGHVRYLEAAAAEATVLVVGVNDDATVRAAKGPGRPILTARERATLVAALRAVQLVTVFPEATADELLRLLRPDVHCKGTDYADGVPEAATAAAIGARVAIVGDPKDHSTRELFLRIRTGA